MSTTPRHPTAGRAGEKRRVVVTGMGVVTSLGHGVDDLWNAVVAGRSGVSEIASFDSRSFPIRIASEVDAGSVPLSPETLSAQGSRVTRRAHLSRSALFGLSALERAWADAAIAPSLIDRDRVGIYIGASSFPPFEDSLGTVPDLMREGRWHPAACFELGKRLPHILAQRSIPEIGTMLARSVGARGPCVTVNTACSSSNQALGEAYNLIRSGAVDVVVSGGTDSMISLFCVVGFTLLGALSRSVRPAHASRPFDMRRDGFVLGEGAGILILENLTHALARGAKIHAEVIGYGASSDGYRLTDIHPNGDGACAAMERALASAQISPSAVGYINAHGTSTPQNDRIETLAIKRVFGTHARRLAVSSTKSVLGHLVCAAGGVEAILTAMTLKTGLLPPTINLENPDPECDLDYVPHTARRAETDVALSNSFGFGGQNGTLALRRWSPSSLTRS